MMSEEQADKAEVLTSSRFPAWTALTIFSCVALIAHTTTDYVDEDSAEKWVTSVCAISLGISFCSMVAHFVPSSNFVGEPTEGGVAFFVIIFWAAGLPVIMNPNNSIAVSAFGIRNANLYFFSWAAFIANLYILGDYAKASDIADVTMAPPKTVKWYGLFASSIIVLGSSAKSFDLLNCKDFSNSTCSRTKYAIALGAVGTFFCMLLCLMSLRGRVPTLVVEMSVSFMLFVMYVFGVGFITFGTGPGTTLGNLYFSTWASFVISMLLFAECLKQFLTNGEEESQMMGDGGPPSIPEEVDEEE